MACKNKPKYNCGSKVNAKCVFYDLTAPSFSKLHDEECLVAEETIEDLYNLVGWVRESIDISDIDASCLDIDKVEDSYDTDEQRYLLKDVVEKLVEKACNDEDSFGGGSGNLNSVIEGLNYRCLVNTCGTNPGSLKELLQMIIDAVCLNGNGSNSPYGHVTIDLDSSTVIDNDFLNDKYPNAPEGFKVTVTPLNTTFMKISGDRWVMTNNIINNNGAQ